MKFFAKSVLAISILTGGAFADGTVNNNVVWNVVQQNEIEAAALDIEPEVISAVGMGVAPENTISPAHSLALAKRAAIVDAYRQLAEKVYGIRINGKDTVKDMVLKDSTVKTKVLAKIKNAHIKETVYKDGLCQVHLELKLNTITKAIMLN